MERVGALRGRVASGPEAAAAYPDGLTQREVEVLRLIAAGKTNREIAEELFISLNTVLHHVSNILSKTGNTNRAGVATYAARHSLAD
jgi:DNA-binding NarL/FixJ family response regulator